MEWNEQQNGVFSWVKTGRGSLNLVARAGCGKTTTLIGVVETIIEREPRACTFLGAFNKAIAGEIGAKLKAKGIDWKQAEASTMHAIGFRLWRKVARDVKVDEKKIENIIQFFIDNAESPMTSWTYRNGASVIKRAVSLAKQSGFGWLVDKDDIGAWESMFEHHGLDESDVEIPANELIMASMNVLARSYEQDRDVIDFDDMISAPMVHRARVSWPYDYVLIDEAQDTNAARRSLALKLLRPRTGRLIAVGDDRQAIYGFTGADSDAMDIIRRELDSTELPLNVTYRCPKAIVREAQKIVPDITAHDSAPEGSVRYETSAERKVFEPTDAILCRNTAPLIQKAFALIGQKVPCRVEGRDIGKSLDVLARRWKVKTLSALRGRLADYLEKQTAKWTAAGKDAKVEALTDKVESLYALMGICESQNEHEIVDLSRLINHMFGDTPNGEPQRMLTLSTVHKAKGREWPRVFILRAKEFMPSKYAKKDWQQLQEQNLIYVAITRAQSELIYLD